MFEYFPIQQHPKHHLKELTENSGGAVNSPFAPVLASDGTTPLY